MIIDLVGAATHGDGAPDACIERILRLVQSHFGVPLAISSRIEGERYIAEWALDKSGEVQAGQLFDLDDTYCSAMLDQEGPLAVAHFGKSEYAAHPCYDRGKLETYLGARLYVDGEVYGTLNLTSPDPYARPFVESDLAVLETAASLISRHLTERRRRTEIAEEERRRTLALTGANFGTWEWNFKTGEVFWSDRVYAIFGEDPATVITSDNGIVPRIHPDDMEAALEAVRLHREENRPFDQEFRARRKDGEWIWVRTRGQAERDKAGEATVFCGWIEDVTEAKQVAEELAQAKERYDLGVAGAAVALWDWDVRTNDLYWSPRFKELLGLPLDYVPNFDSFASRLHEEDRDEILAALYAHIEKKSEYDVEYRLRTEAGDYVWCHTRGQAVWDDQGEPVRMAGSLVDVSERRSMEEEVRRIKERYDVGVNSADVGIWDWDVQKDEVYWSPFLREKFAIAADEALDPARIESLIHPDDRLAHGQAVERHLAGAPGYAFDMRMRGPDGEYSWVAIRGQAVWNEAGEPVRLAGTLIDISERKAAEVELRQQRQHLEMMGRASQTGYWILPMPEAAPIWSEEVFHIHDVDPAVGSPDLEAAINAYHPEDRERVEQYVAKTLETGESFAFELRLVRLGGEIRNVRSTGEAMFNPLGEIIGVFGTFQDVTDQRVAERRYREQAEELQRVNSELERFATIASHDLKEPLRKVSAFGDLLGVRYGDKLDERGREMLGIMVDGAQRMQVLIDDLLRYAKSGSSELKRKTVNFADIITDAEEMVSTSIREANALIEIGAMPEVEADAGLMRHLVQNLLSNAVKYRGEEPPVIQVSATEEAQEWRFCVCDNGIGFPAEDAEAIFKLFTRLHGRGEYGGTGVGLALCQRIVERHGGRIWAKSTPGQGAQFYFTLPKASQG